MKVISQISFFSYNIQCENIKYYEILHRTFVVNQKVYNKADTKNDWSRFCSFLKNKRKTMLHELHQCTVNKENIWNYLDPITKKDAKTIQPLGFLFWTLKKALNYS